MNILSYLEARKQLSITKCLLFIVSPAFVALTLTVFVFYCAWHENWSILTLFEMLAAFWVLLFCALGVIYHFYRLSYEKEAAKLNATLDSLGSVASLVLQCFKRE